MALIIALFILVIVQGVTSETCYANVIYGTPYTCNYGCCYYSQTNVCCDAPIYTKPVVICGITIASIGAFITLLKLIWICLARTTYYCERRNRRRLSESCTDTTQDNGSINEASQNNNNASAHSTLPPTYATLESYGYKQSPSNHKNGLSKY